MSESQQQQQQEIVAVKRKMILAPSASPNVKYMKTEQKKFGGSKGVVLDAIVFEQSAGKTGKTSFITFLIEKVRSFTPSNTCSGVVTNNAAYLSLVYVDKLDDPEHPVLSPPVPIVLRPGTVVNSMLGKKNPVNKAGTDALNEISAAYIGPVTITLEINGTIKYDDYDNKKKKGGSGAGAGAPGTEVGGEVGALIPNVAAASTSTAVTASTSKDGGGGGGGDQTSAAPGSEVALRSEIPSGAGAGAAAAGGGDKKKKITSTFFTISSIVPVKGKDGKAIDILPCDRYLYLLQASTAIMARALAMGHLSSSPKDVGVKTNLMSLGFMLPFGDVINPMITAHTDTENMYRPGVIEQRMVRPEDDIYLNVVKDPNSGAEKTSVHFKVDMHLKYLVANPDHAVSEEGVESGGSAALVSVEKYVSSPSWEFYSPELALGLRTLDIWSSFCKLPDLSGFARVIYNISNPDANVNPGEDLNRANEVMVTRWMLDFEPLTTKWGYPLLAEQLDKLYNDNSASGKKTWVKYRAKVLQMHEKGVTVEQITWVGTQKLSATPYFLNNITNLVVVLDYFPPNNWEFFLIPPVQSILKKLAEIKVDAEAEDANPEDNFEMPNDIVEMIPLLPKLGSEGSKPVTAESPLTEIMNAFMASDAEGFYLLLAIPKATNKMPFLMDPLFATFDRDATRAYNDTEGEIGLSEQKVEYYKCPSKGFLNLPPVPSNLANATVGGQGSGPTAIAAAIAATAAVLAGQQ